MKKIFLIILLFFVGCKSVQQPHFSQSDYNLAEDITTVYTSISETTGGIRDTNNQIRGDAVTIRNSAETVSIKIPAESGVNSEIETIKNKSVDILSHTDDIAKLTGQLELAQGNLQISVAKVDQIKKNNELLQKEKDEVIVENDKLKQEIQNTQQRMFKVTTFLFPICAIGIGLSAALIFFKQIKFGIAGIVACGTTIIVAITISKMAAYLAIAGAIILLLIMGFILWQLFVNRKTIFELVETVEVAKDNMPEDAKTKVFGDNKNPGLADKLQSTATKAVVKTEKSNLGNLWSYAKEKTS